VGVLRPNGHLVISDSRGLIGDIGLPVVKVDEDGKAATCLSTRGSQPTISRPPCHSASRVRRCEEPRRPSPLVGDDGTDRHDGVRPPDYVSWDPPVMWSLHARATDATNAAWRGQPAGIIWQFQLSAE
jgi:hypothetical protein